MTTHQETIVPTKRTPAWHAGFMAMLPTFRKRVRTAFRQLDNEAKEEAVTETVANALVAYVTMFEQGKLNTTHPGALARFAVAQVCDGRKVGNRFNGKEVLSRPAQKRHGFTVVSLQRLHERSGAWVEATIEDCNTPVPDQAAFRCDFPAWLATQSQRNRRIAQALALGHSTLEVARRFKLTSARVSQLRREFRDSWLAFHNETSASESIAVASA